MWSRDTYFHPSAFDKVRVEYAFPSLTALHSGALACERGWCVGSGKTRLEHEVT